MFTALSLSIKSAWTFWHVALDVLNLKNANIIWQSVLGSAAAISQLLDQAISLVKRIQEAREKVRGASERIDRYKDQLHNLLDTLILVQNERELQTPAIEEATQTIIGTSQELMDHLNVLALRNTKNKAIQYIHVLASGERDENILDDILDRLDRGRAELSVRITTTHVGLSGTIHDGFLAALSIVRRVDENVQRVLGERLVITTRLEGRELPPNGEFSCSSASR
jgi:hypothetical protein